MEVKKWSIIDDENKKTRYLIPFYQRSYTWGRDSNSYNIKGLLNDLHCLTLKNKNGEQKVHYFGHMIFKKDQVDKGGVELIKVVDGQQRISTIMLIAKWVTYFMDLNQIDDANLRKNYISLFKLSNCPIQFRIDFRCEKEEMKTLLGMSYTNLKNHVLKNAKGLVNDYEKAFKIIDKKMIEFLKEKGSKKAILELLRSFLENGVSKLIASSCELSSNDDEGVVFENSNSKGVSLLDEELIKNYIITRKAMGDKENTYDDIFEGFEINKDKEQILSHFWKFFQIYFKNQGKKNIRRHKNYYSVREIFESDEWENMSDWKDNIKDLFKVFYLIHVSIDNPWGNQQNGLGKFFCDKFLNKWFSNHSILFLLCVTMTGRGSYDYNYYFHSLGILLCRLLVKSAKNPKLFTINQIEEVESFCKILNNYYLNRVMNKEEFGYINNDTIPLISSFIKKKGDGIKLKPYENDYGHRESMESLEKLLLEEEEQKFLKRNWKPKSYRMELFTKERFEKLESFEWKGKGKLSLVKPILVFLEVIERKKAAINQKSIKCLSIEETIEHIKAQNPKSRENDEYTHMLGNLMLLSQSDNSSASNRDFKDKVPTYLKSTLSMAGKVGRETSWDDKAVEKRSKEIVEKISNIVC